jgi:succinate-acetate transporter protein
LREDQFQLLVSLRKVGTSMAQFATTPTQPERVESVAVTSVANPIPLGMSALAFTTAVIGCAYAGFVIPYVAGASIRAAVGAALFYGGFVQILAGMWEFKKDNTMAATLFSSYGGFLVAMAVVFIPGFGIYSALNGAGLLHSALGLLFLCWTIFTGVLVLGSLRTNATMILTLLLLLVAYLFLTIGQLASANDILLHIGGWVGIAAAIVGWYAALVTMLSSGGFRLPLGRSNR